jgi:hypothetical protein
MMVCPSISKNQIRERRASLLYNSGDTEEHDTRHETWRHGVVVVDRAGDEDGELSALHTPLCILED